MRYEDACFGQLIKVIKGPYAGRTFMIEDRSSTIADAIVVADNENEQYLHFSCEDLELLSPTFAERQAAQKPLSQAYYDAEADWEADKDAGRLDD